MACKKKSTNDTETDDSDVLRESGELRKKIALLKAERTLEKGTEIVDG